MNVQVAHAFGYHFSLESNLSCYNKGTQNSSSLNKIEVYSLV